MAPRKKKATPLPAPTMPDLPPVEVPPIEHANVPVEVHEKLRALCRRAVECLKGHSNGNEHIEVQANALLEELDRVT